MVDLTEFRDLAAHQRACRSYLPDPVEPEVIEDLLACAVRAPSAENRQPWQFVVITERNRRAAVWNLARRAWNGGASDAAATSIPADMHAAVDHGIAEGFEAAPVTIVVGADLDRCRTETIGSSLFPAVQNLLLAATAHGLGCALTTISTVFADDLSSVVGFPPTIRPVAVVPIGHPARPLGTSRREPVAEHAHRERFGEGW